MRWEYDGSPWVAGRRVEAWSGDTGALGAALPDGAAVAISSDVKARNFHMWAYTPEGGDLRLTIPFAALVWEQDAASLPTGRFDPTGQPGPFYHGGMIKFLLKSWNGGGDGPAPLIRVYTFIRLVP